MAVLTALIVAGKSVLAALIAFAFPHPARTALVVAAGLSQIGEFSFIVGQSGFALGLLDDTQYSLILASAIVSITLNPWMFRLINPIERLLKRSPALWTLLDRHGPSASRPAETLTGHVVIVGCGRVGRHIAGVLGKMSVPRLVVEADVSLLERLHQLAVPVLYGDAANSEILNHAGLERARALVITVPDDTAALLIAVSARRLAPSLRVIARASTWKGARQLVESGVNEIVRPELEGGVEIVRRTLLGLDVPESDVRRYTNIVRQEDVGDSYKSEV